MDISNLLASVANNHKKQFLESINSLPKTNLKENSSKFVDGEIVKGEVVDIKGLVANILTDKGQVLNGHLQNIGQLSIGDERSFIVKNEDGQATFSIVSEDENLLYEQSLKKELQSQGISANEKDIQTAKTLIKNELPVNKDTFSNLSRALSLLAKDGKSLDKALYLLKNEIPINSKNTSMIDNLVNKGITMLGNAEEIENGVASIKDNTLKSELLKLFNNDTNIEEYTTLKGEVTKNNQFIEGANSDSKSQGNIENSIKQSAEETLKNVENELNKEVNTEIQKSTNKNNFLLNTKDGILKDDIKEFIKTDKVVEKDDIIKDIFKFSPKTDKPKEIDEFLNKTNEKIDKAIDLLKNSNDEGASKLLQTLTTHKESIDFMQFAKNNVYLQIPLNINDNKTNGELLVFKDKRKKKGSKEGISAVIGLDTVNLGRYETYIHKSGNKINLQFRLNDNDVIKLTKNNFKALEELLSQYNLVIESATYKTITESFTLVSKEEDILSESDMDNSLRNYKFNVKL